MHVDGSEFPGLTTNGGYAELLRTGAGSLIKLPQTLFPARRRAPRGRRAHGLSRGQESAAHLVPGERVVVIGVGGLGHIGIQSCARSAPRTSSPSTAPTSRSGWQGCGAHHVVKADGNQVQAVKDLTQGKGAEAVIDFVGEGNSIKEGLEMTRNAGAYYIVGYGGEIRISATT